MSEYLKVPTAWLLGGFTTLVAQGALVWRDVGQVKDAQRELEKRQEKLEKKVDDVAIQVSEFRKEAQEKFVKIDVLWSKWYGGSTIPKTDLN